MKSERGVTIRRTWLALAGALLLIAGFVTLFRAPEPPASEQALPAAGQFTFTAWDGPDLPVYYQLPDTVTRDTLVVFVMHGVKRDADRYRDEWADLARQHGFIAVVPQFGKSDFPGSRGYNTGYFAQADGTPRPRGLWSFAAIEPLFDDVRKRFGTGVPRYAIYGHSAGAQFVHRFVLFMPEARIERAIAANAGWYTMPDPGIAFPYGLGDAPVDERGLNSALGKRMTVLLGTADTDRSDPDLRKTPEADAQGPHRFARGQTFFAQGQAAAAKRKARFGWTLETVPGVGHSNGKMASAAAEILTAE
jgi:poly(3-hydroxybutyrate) depolymerase